MHVRFLTNLTLLVLGAVLAATALALGQGSADWLAVGAGGAAALIAVVGFARLDRGAPQRRLDVLTFVAGLAAGVGARTFGHPHWFVFAAGCTLAGLGAAGLILNEFTRPRVYPATNGRAPDGRFARHQAQGWTVTGPLANSYWSAAILVVFALVPYLVLATTVGAVGDTIGRDVGLSPQAMSLTNGMSNAGYAVATVIALQLTVHLRGRRLLVGYALTFVLGSVMAAWAPSAGLFVTGRILQGTTTGLMLIAAVPPLVIGWPPERLKTTAMVMNMGIFGAVAAGPVIGGVVAGSGPDAWRVLFWLVTGLGLGAFLLTLLTFHDQEPQDPSAPWAPGAIALAAAGCGLTFFGSAELTSHRFVTPWVMLPLLTGIACIVALVVQQYRSKDPLMPVRRLTSTFPVVGILIAICAGASSIAIIELVSGALNAKGTAPGHIGTLFWPQFGGAMVSALAFGLLFTTKWTKLIAFGGLVLVAVAGVILTGVSGGGEGLVWVGSGLLGLGVGASVAPALFIAGFSLPSNNVARIFALIELLRAVAAFSVAPVLAHLAATTGGDPVTGTRTAIWICVGIAGGGALVALYLFVIARAKPHHPDIDRWIGGDEPAFDSPALAAALRGLEPDPKHHSDYPHRERELVISELP